MFKFLGVIIFLFASFLLLALVLGRKLENNEERSRRDDAIRDGLSALKDRIGNLREAPR